MLSFKQTVKILKAADFIIVVYNDNSRAIADFVGYSEEGDEESDFSIGCPESDDISFKWEQKYEMTSYRRDDRGVFMRGFYIDNCWVIPVKAGRA